MTPSCEEGATSAATRSWWLGGAHRGAFADKEHQTEGRDHRSEVTSKAAAGSQCPALQRWALSGLCDTKSAGCDCRRVLCLVLPIHPTKRVNAALFGLLCLKEQNRKALTFDFERRPLEPSIQTYSAMTWPFWGRLRYFWSCKWRIS